MGGKYQEISVLTEEHIESVDDVFKPIIASAIMQAFMKRIEEDKKDVEALTGAIDLFKKDVLLPAFSGAKKKDWIKQLKKARDKAEGKEKKKVMNRSNEIYKLKLESK